MDNASESLFRGAVMMAPMTVGSNLPYRRLCDELGATVTMGEMAVARNLLKGKRQELVLLKRSGRERCFGVQLAGREEDELRRAAALAAEGGADLVDLNCGCPIDAMTRRGLGSALLRRPRKIERLVRALGEGAPGLPVTVKIRLGWSDGELVHRDAARAAVAGGASAIVVHGRTRQARYRKPASWESVGEVVESVDVPVIGNGDILFPEDAREGVGISGCAGVMIARGALVKPWIFREMGEGVLDLSGEERLAIYLRYAELAKEHFGCDGHGMERVRKFLAWHLDFWTRYVPPRPDGTLPRMQEREESFAPRTELEALLSRPDAPAIDHLARWLAGGGGEGLLPGPGRPGGGTDSGGRAPIPMG